MYLFSAALQQLNKYENFIKRAHNDQIPTTEIDYLCDWLTPQEKETWLATLEQAELIHQPTVGVYELTPMAKTARYTLVGYNPPYTAPFSHADGKFEE